MALRRLNQLKKRFLKDPAFFERYREKIESYLSNGYAQQVSLDAGISMKAWYLPHHAVQEKFRVVFDCGASYKGTSLNSQLLQGPDQTSSLIGVLLRFRRGEVAVMADVKAMFHQVRVEPDDSESLRFLWWPKSDFNLPPVDFQMLVHIFGATSSPSMCSFALKRAALDNEIGASEQTVSAVSKSFYVDDFLGSFLSMEEATSVLKQLRLLLSNCGFRLTKFVSNFNCVLEDIPQEDTRLNLETTEVLGLPWHIHSDTLSVDVEISSKEVTGRGILSMISQIFDPLEFLQPFLLPVKKLLQELAVNGLGWDDPIPEKQSCYWEKWFRCLSGLTQLNLPRAYFPHGFQPVDVQLHCFSDTSQSGYGAVAYLSSENNLGQVKCSFVMGRSRVTPVKPITIPRLELAAAVVAVELVQMLKRELDVEIADVYFWTDSTSVLRYIRSTAKRFHQFVANWIAAIQSGSTACQWCYVNTAFNPADVFSRGLMPEQLDCAYKWINGPEFLFLDQEQWPSLPDDLILNPGDPELKKVVNAATIKDDVSELSLYRLLAYYSDWDRLKRAVAWILRWKDYCLWRWKRLDSVETSCLTTSELDRSSLEIVKLVQSQHFRNE